jgi:choice-of-anchor C domain-containing protein
MIVKAKLLSIAASIALFATVSPASANLIINGNFETGIGDASFPGFSTLNGGSTNITGWTVTGGSVDWINGYWTAQDGTHSIDLNGTSQGGLQQTINTVLGQHYLMTFYISGNPDSVNDGPGGGTRTLDVSAGGAPVSYQYVFTTPPNSRTNMLWEKESLSFTGTGSSTVISFASTTGDGNCCWGPALDHVSVSAVPELSTWAMMFIGFAGIGMIAYRRAHKASPISTVI